MKIDISKAIKLLQEKRKCFVSEADFQLELAWILKDMYTAAKVRCEYVPEYNTSMHIDILVIYEDKWIPIELKYKTKGCVLSVGDEKYTLKNQGAKDISCYLYLYDVQRIEKIKQQIGEKFAEGYAIMLTNDLSYCKAPQNPDCFYAEFSLADGEVKKGHLDWAENTGKGTKEQCEDPIVLNGEYKCEWTDYSVIEDSRVGKFRYLLFTVV